MTEVVTLIPARGGSRGLAQKNVRRLGGLPLIAWSIRQALEAKSVDRVVVSTDDEHIADIAREHGAEVPWQRPVVLARDDSIWFDAVMHGLDALDTHRDVGILVVLQPTSPLRTASDIDGAVARIQSREAEAVIGVAPVEFPVAFANTLPDDDCMDGFLPAGFANMRRQELPQHWRLNGALYAGRPAYLREYRGFHGPKTYAWKMPRARSIDIDDAEDLRFAEALLTTHACAEATL